MRERKRVGEWERGGEEEKEMEERENLPYAIDVQPPTGNDKRKLTSSINVV